MHELSVSQKLGRPPLIEGMIGNIILDQFPKNKRNAFARDGSYHALVKIAKTNICSREFAPEACGNEKEFRKGERWINAHSLLTGAGIGITVVGVLIAFDIIPPLLIGGGVVSAISWICLGAVIGVEGWVRTNKNRDNLEKALVKIAKVLAGRLAVQKLVRQALRNMEQNGDGAAQPEKRLGAV